MRQFYCYYLSGVPSKRAKSYGGATSIQLPKNQKLVIATWKEADLWYLTREMKPSETAETYTFKENSSYGIWEGTVTFIETK